MQKHWNFLKKNIIKNGFNLVGNYLYDDSQVSLKEIEFDIKNKDIKYIFLLTYKYYKGPDYDLFFFENDTDKNPDILDPNKEILKLKPGFINTSSDFRATIIKNLTKEVDKLKSKFDGIDSSTYDTELVNTLKLTEENTSFLIDLNNKNTIIGGVTLYLENKNIPEDLKSKKLAIVGTTDEEFRGNKVLNLFMKSAIKKYPFGYTYFKNYKSYEAAGGDKNFKYKFQMIKYSASFFSSSKPKFTGTEIYKRDMGKTGVNPSFGSMPKNYEKELFTIILKNNETNVRYIVSKKDFVARAIKDFVSQLERS